MGELNSTNGPWDNPGESGKIRIKSTESTEGSQSTPWYPLSSEEMVYMCVILTRYSEKENTNNKSKSFGPRRTADSPFLWRADY